MGAELTGTDMLDDVAPRLHPMKAGVVMVGSFHGGSVGNIIRQRAEMVGTVRCFDPAIRDNYWMTLIEAVLPCPKVEGL